MEQTIVNYLLQQGIAIVILSVGLYYMTKYFMGQIEKKDVQNQSNLDKYFSLHEKTMDVINKLSNSIDSLQPKLHEMHEDIKFIKNK